MFLISGIQTQYSGKSVTSRYIRFATPISRESSATPRNGALEFIAGPALQPQMFVENLRAQLFGPIPPCLRSQPERRVGPLAKRPLEMSGLPVPTHFACPVIRERYSFDGIARKSAEVPQFDVGVRRSRFDTFDKFALPSLEYGPQPRLMKQNKCLCMKRVNDKSNLDVIFGRDVDELFDCTEFRLLVVR